MTWKRRFLRYLGGFVSSAPGLATVYPGLRAEPWPDPRRFPITTALEAACEAIAREVAALDPRDFHPESERAIARTGSWDVFVLYERGRKRAGNCARVPETMRVLDAYPVVRTHAGLAYFSRLRAGTQIAAHRGPTNMRVRCHLPLVVPDGDCALRVGDVTRRWERGRCLVFDDFCEHEAWNRTGGDRIVLIVDCWHPDLSPREIALLGGLQARVAAQAENLARYWSANERSANTTDVWK